jgi:hypothetical protein
MSKFGYTAAPYTHAAERDYGGPQEPLPFDPLAPKNWAEYSAAHPELRIPPAEPATVYYAEMERREREFDTQYRNFVRKHMGAGVVVGILLPTAVALIQNNWAMVAICVLMFVYGMGNFIVYKDAQYPKDGE